MKKHFIFYHTEYCHLCELALALITPYQQHLDLAIQHCDIVHDDALLEQYGVRIPVLQHQHSQLELAWPFDEESLHAFLVATVN